MAYITAVTIRKGYLYWNHLITNPSSFSQMFSMIKVKHTNICCMGTGTIQICGYENANKNICQGDLKLFIYNINL